MNGEKDEDEGKEKITSKVHFLDQSHKALKIETFFGRQLLTLLMNEFQQQFISIYRQMIFVALFANVPIAHNCKRTIDVYPNFCSIYFTAMSLH